MNGGVGHVVCLKLDRFFRDAEASLRQTKAWDQAVWNYPDPGRDTRTRWLMVN